MFATQQGVKNHITRHDMVRATPAVEPARPGARARQDSNGRLRAAGPGRRPGGGEPDSE